MCENKCFKGIREVLNGWKIVNRYVKVGLFFCMFGGYIEIFSIFFVGEMVLVIWRGSLVIKICSSDWYVIIYKNILLFWLKRREKIIVIIFYLYFLFI